MNRNRLLALDRANAWIALLGIWAALVAAGISFGSVDTTVRHFTGRIMGQAVVLGLDPALRIRAYIIICAVALAAAALVIITLYHLQAWAAARGHVLLHRREQHTASLLALAGISDLALFVLTAEPAYRRGAEFLLLCTALLATGPTARLLVHRSDNAPWSKPFASPLTQGAILLLAYQLSVGVGALMELPLELGAAALGRFLLAWLLLEVAVGIVTFRHGAVMAADGTGVRLLRASLPLLWLPAVAPLASELQYTLRTHFVWTPLALAWAMALALVFTAVGLWLREPSARSSARAALRLVRRWYVPVVVITSALLTLHRQTITIDAVDAYHHGEMTTPVAQILQHGRIPYLETCLPHGLMDIVPQILFGILNGAQGWDMLIWGNGHWAGWLTLTAGVGLVYALLVTVASPLAALLVLLFLPAELLFSFQYAPLIICVLALVVFLQDGGMRRAWLLPASVLAVFLWRVDFGLAALVATSAVLGIVAWSCRRMRWVPLLLATGAILAATGGLAIALATLRGVSLGDVLRTFVTYVSIQITLASYYNVYDKMSPLVVLQYVFLPAIGLLIVLFCGVRAVLFRHCAPPRVYGLLFLAVLSMVLSVRSLQRHSLYENAFSPYLFLFLLATMPALLRSPRRAVVSILLVVITAGAAFVLPDAHALFRDVKWPAIVGGPPRYAFHTWSGSDQRVLVPDSDTDDVVRWLRAHLQPGQTFYDFTNAPLLYFLTGAELPTYIIESSYYAPDDLQRAALRDLEAWRSNGRLPFVIFKQHTGFDAMDGVPNEIRSYRIVEYLYAHYVPWTNAGRFEIWIDKRLASEVRSDTGLEAPVVAQYPLPLRTPTASANVSVQPTASGGLILAGSSEPVWIDDPFVLPEQVVWAAGLEYELHLRYTTSAPGIVHAVFRFMGPSGPMTTSADVVAAPSLDDRPVDVRLPLRLGTTEPPALTGIRLVLPPAATVTIESAGLEVRRRPAGAPPAWAWSPVGEPYLQRFDLFRLPYIWANFDDHDPVHTATELQTLHSGNPVDIEPGREQVFAVRPTAMESGQYLYLRLQSDSPAKVTVAYGDAAHPNAVSMLVQAAPEPQDYLIRISTQWQWYRGAVTALRLSSTSPVSLDALRVLAGD